MLNLIVSIPVSEESGSADFAFTSKDTAGDLAILQMTLTYGGGGTTPVTSTQNWIIFE